MLHLDGIVEQKWAKWTVQNLQMEAEPERTTVHKNGVDFYLQRSYGVD